jgi:hypothetical protein
MQQLYARLRTEQLVYHSPVSFVHFDVLIVAQKG